ncbi:MAG: hypothetical protein LQ343_003821 [Gyalolechia ehrenbergii]|nr:MAG: hypothetical protein LQ343_003821 [Gyalolechia ehrenbergii]
MAFHEKFVVLRPDHEEKEYRPPPNEPELSLTSHLPEPPDAALRNPQLQAHVSQKPPLWRKRRFWLPTATLLLFAAIIGGTLGGLTRRKDASSKPAPTVLPSPAAASTVLSDTASTLTPTPSAASTVPSDTASTLTPTPSAASALFNSSLASVSWTDSDGVGYRRLYYQDSSGTIKESAWNSSAGNWYSSNEAIANTTSKSPLAACVAGPRLSPFQLNLYFLNARGELVELYTHDGQSWSSGGMSDENIVPSPHSDLAAIWASYDGVPCYSCGGADPHLIYQDSNDKLWVVNATASGYRYTKLAADPVPGSGLAMSLEWRSEGGPGLRLYYQKGADGLISADWEDWETGSGEFRAHEESIPAEADIH